MSNFKSFTESLQELFDGLGDIDVRQVMRQELDLHRAVCDTEREVNKGTTTLPFAPVDATALQAAFGDLYPKKIDGATFKFIVKLKEQGTRDRIRNLSPETRLNEVNEHVEHDPAIPAVSSESRPQAGGIQWKRVVSTRVLKSGDVEIFTCNAEDVETLSKAKQWVKMFGTNAYIQVNTFGIIAHTINTATINFADEDKTRQTAEAICSANFQKWGILSFTPDDITYIGWLKKKMDFKNQRFASAVIEFRSPELANKALDHGLALGGDHHNCVRYDRDIRLKHCLHCQGYGHMSSQCTAPKRCGSCAGRCEAKCTAKGGLKKCCVCGGPHPVWSDKCPTRKLQKAQLKIREQTSMPRWPVSQPVPLPTNQALVTSSIKQTQPPVPRPAIQKEKEKLDTVYPRNPTVGPTRAPAPATGPTLETPRTRTRPPPCRAQKRTPSSI